MAQVWPISKGYVDTPDGQIHYRRCGDEAPTVLLLHASPSSSAMFTSALPRLANKGVFAVAIDLPNCGESYVTRGEPKLPDLAQSILAAVQLLNFPRAFNIVGHQVGASLAIYVASQFPQHIKKVVIWGAPILSVMGRGDLLREDAPDYGEDFIGTIQSYVSERYPDEGHPWQLKIRGLIEMLQTYERRPWASRPMALVDSEAVLKQLQQPTLCMAGDMEPFQKSTMKAALLLQNGKYHNLGPAGSDVVDEFPEEYVQNIVEFLRMSGLPTERASCTIPNLRADDQVRRTSAPGKAPSLGGADELYDESDVKARPRNNSLPSPTTPLQTAPSSNSSSVPSPVNSAGSSPDLRPTASEQPRDSERRPSSERRRISLKGLMKGKFS